MNYFKSIDLGSHPITGQLTFVAHIYSDKPEDANIMRAQLEDHKNQLGFKCIDYSTKYAYSDIKNELKKCIHSYFYLLPIHDCYMLKSMKKLSQNLIKLTL